MGGARETRPASHLFNEGPPSFWSLPLRSGRDALIARWCVHRRVRRACNRAKVATAARKDHAPQRLSQDLPFTTAIYWIGGLLGLVVLAGCRSDRLNEHGQTFSAASINSILHALGS